MEAVAEGNEPRAKGAEVGEEGEDEVEEGEARLVEVVGLLDEEGRVGEADRGRLAGRQELGGHVRL